MKKLVLALCFVSSYAYGQTCENANLVRSVNINLPAASGSTQLIAADTGKIIYVCGYILTSTADATVSFTYGTGTNCGTGTVTLETLLLSTSIGLGVSVPNTGAVQYKTAESNALCISRSASTAIGGRMTYVVR